MNIGFVEMQFITVNWFDKNPAGKLSFLQGQYNAGSYHWSCEINICIASA